MPTLLLAMEATLFSGWIYDTLKPYGEQLEMAHPAKMKAISAGSYWSWLRSRKD